MALRYRGTNGVVWRLGEYRALGHGLSIWQQCWAARKPARIADEGIWDEIDEAWVMK
jgi:hypothetical protein